MTKEAVFTMKLESELRDAFMAEAEAADRPASQIVRELMREFIRRREEERDYDEFVARKVEIARKSIEAGQFFTDEEVNAEMDELLARLEAKRVA